MNNWVQTDDTWTKVSKGSILEIAKIDDDYCLFDVTKKRMVIGYKSKLCQAKSLGNRHLLEIKRKRNVRRSV